MSLSSIPDFLLNVKPLMECINEVSASESPHGAKLRVRGWVVEADSGGDGGGVPKLKVALVT